MKRIFFLFLIGLAGFACEKDNPVESSTPKTTIVVDTEFVVETLWLTDTLIEYITDSFYDDTLHIIDSVVNIEYDDVEKTEAFVASRILLAKHYGEFPAPADYYDSLRGNTWAFSGGEHANKLFSIYSFFWIYETSYSYLCSLQYTGQAGSQNEVWDPRNWELIGLHIELNE